MFVAAVILYTFKRDDMGRVTNINLPRATKQFMLTIDTYGARIGESVSGLFRLVLVLSTIDHVMGQCCRSLGKKISSYVSRLLNASHLNTKRKKKTGTCLRRYLGPNYVTNLVTLYSYVYNNIYSNKIVR